MLAELGRDDEAKKLYLAWLATHPADRQAHYDVACLLEDMGDEAGSRTAFEEMVKRFPHDAPAIKRLANACIRDADYTRALALYDSLPESEHDHDTLENFAMLAESLDDHAAELRALQLTAKQMDEPSVDIYLDMADTASYLPDNQVPVQVLRDALKVLPDSAQLRIALATQHLRNEEPNEALIVLTDERLRSNFDAIETLLGMSAYITDAPRVLAFLGNDIEKRFPLTSANRLQLAVIEYNGGRIADSERLFAGVPEQPENLQALAEARFHTGNYEESARLMAGYLKSHPQAKANDWLFLGDIYEQLGMFEEARKAYDYSLALLTADLPVTASNQPRGAE
jgi:tetratricopeptide (TPR) repeat protein